MPDAQIFSGINRELRQGCDPEQAGAVRVRDDRAQAGEKIARLGRIHHVHVLDGERNALPCQFGGQLIAIDVGAVEDGAVAPLAARLAAQFAQLRDQLARTRCPWPSSTTASTGTRGNCLPARAASSSRAEIRTERW